MTTRVGFIGLGLMGKPMGLNLLKAKFPLTVWNRTRARTEPLAAAGATVGATPREVAERSDVVITIVSDPPALESVLWGADGAMDGMKRGGLLIDSSTVSPALARRVAADCAQRGIEFLDAPVTGGTWGAEKGELVFMIGGKAETLERARPVFEAMGKRFFHLGENGAGQTVKLAMNLILALEVQALCEALALVAGSGVPGQKLIEVMQASMARAPVLDVKAPLILEHKYAPSFPLRLMHKDVGLALELGNQTGVALPAAAAAREVYNYVLGAAKEDLDYAAIAKFWESR
ncbi:MAG TPA: NAD(P)-dependent oxidoreductase [Patescibacteria group bacterium]|nr:NAD(P)-dependent oxidoreductase [Patescibacteria group bacterium]